jgi:hypothetical protein
MALQKSSTRRSDRPQSARRALILSTSLVAAAIAAPAALRPAQAQSDVAGSRAQLPADADTRAAGQAVAAARAAAPIELVDDVPDKHIVVRGDTLWDISARFLKSPWLWPQVWELNRDEIRNPHLIYPGNVVYLDRSGPSPRLRLGRAVGDGDLLAANSVTGHGRLEPTVRAQSLGREAIPTVSMAAIEPFINKPLIVEEKGLAQSPRIMATQEGRVYLGRGDRAYVRGIQDDRVSDWHVYRPAKPLLDPDTRKTLAYEALYLGTAQLSRKGDPATVVITSNAEEIGEGDRLIPAERGVAPQMAPRAPERDVLGKIVSVYRGVTQVGRHSVVALNVGRRNGLEVGHVMSVQQHGRLARDREANQMVRLPDEPIGQLLVFRTFENISYGLIVDASQSISVGDSVKNP